MMKCETQIVAINGRKCRINCDEYDAEIHSEWKPGMETKAPVEAVEEPHTEEPGIIPEYIKPKFMKAKKK